MKSLGTWKALILAAAASAFGAQASAASHIAVTGGARSVAHYECDDGKQRAVTYVNGEPDHLAIVPVEGAERIFVNVIAASGARYASGRYVWWTKGRSASLYDIMRGPDAAPVASCHEAGS